MGRAIKNLLAGADEPLKAVHAAFAAVRARYYAFTLPWVSDPHAERQHGPRLLPNALLDQFVTDISAPLRPAIRPPGTAKPRRAVWARPAH